MGFLCRRNNQNIEADPFSVQTVQRDDSAVQRGSETMRPQEHVNIRPIQPADFEAVWQIFHEVVANADTYAFAPDTTRDEALRLWLEVPLATFVAEVEGQIVGTYFLKPNQPGLGSHVCNAGYMVSRSARGKGVGETMCAHSMEEARRLGFQGHAVQLRGCNELRRALVDAHGVCHHRSFAGGVSRVPTVCTLMRWSCTACSRRAVTWSQARKQHRPRIWQACPPIGANDCGGSRGNQQAFAQGVRRDNELGHAGPGNFAQAVSGHVRQATVDVHRACRAEDNCALYLTNAAREQASMAKLTAAYKAAGRTLAMGKGCLRFKTLEELPMDVIAKMAGSTPVARRIELAEATTAKK